MKAPARIRSTPAEPQPAVGVILVCFFLSGATALVYEVVWLRMLGVIFGHTVYAITTVLAAFMAGLGLGSFLFGRRASEFADPLRIYGLIEIGIGISCALIPGLVWLASFVYPGLHGVLGASYAAFGFVQFLLVCAILILPTTLMGGTLPILSQALVSREESIGRRVGGLYALNTAGAVVGVIAAGYGLLPAVGNRYTLWIAAAANVAIGLVVILYGRSLRTAATDPARQSGSAPPRSAATTGSPAAPAAASAPRTARAAKPAARAAGRASPAATRTAGTAAASAPAAAPLPPAQESGAWFVAIGLAISGAVSMIYEVAWTRALSLVIGSSTYAFTAMLVAFVLGIAAGAALYSLWWGNRRATPAAFALIQIGIGVAAAAMVLVFDRSPELLLLALAHSLAPDFVALVQIGASVLALLPTTLLIGATFPCAVAACARTPAYIGHDVGRLYGLNTVGAIVGTIVAGFVLVPALGVHASIKVGIVVNLALAALLCASGPRPVPGWRWGAGGFAVAAGAAAAFIPPWDPLVMSTGPAVYARQLLEQAKTAGIGAALRTDELLFYRDGPGATVSVTRDGERISLRVNGKVDASTTPSDMPTQLMLGHLPLLLHRDPKDVLVIGLGGGTTAGAVARHAVERLDVVEIEPAVIEASRFFTRENGDVLADPRLRMTIADGRNYLLTTPERYDVIISEPSNPWIGGIASLFSVEFFELARQRLKPEGIIAQWVQAYSLPPADFQMIVKTFASVFPAMSIWHITAGDYLLLGRMEPVPIDLALIQARYESNPAVRRDLESIDVRAWPGVLGHLMLGQADAGRYAAGASLNTDDRLPLEFSAPRALYLDTAIPNWILMQRSRLAEFPDMTAQSREALENAPARYAIGMVYLARSVLPAALAHFERALALDPAYTPAVLGSSTVFLREGQYEDALARAQSVLGREPRNLEALVIAGLASAGLNAEAQSAAFLQRALAVRPQSEIQELARKLTPKGIQPRK